MPAQALTHSQALLTPTLGVHFSAIFKGVDFSFDDPVTLTGGTLHVTTEKLRSYDSSSLQTSARISIPLL